MTLRYSRVSLSAPVYEGLSSLRQWDQTRGESQQPRLDRGVQIPDCSSSPDVKGGKRDSTKETSSMGAPPKASVTLNRLPPNTFPFPTPQTVSQIQAHTRRTSPQSGQLCVEYFPCWRQSSWLRTANCTRGDLSQGFRVSQGSQGQENTAPLGETGTRS